MDSSEEKSEESENCTVDDVSTEARGGTSRSGSCAGSTSVYSGSIGSRSHVSAGSANSASTWGGCNVSSGNIITSRASWAVRACAGSATIRSGSAGSSSGGNEDGGDEKEGDKLGHFYLSNVKYFLFIFFFVLLIFQFGVLWG